MADSNDKDVINLCAAIGCCTRVAESPFNTSKIITFINRYEFLNLLPFPVMLKGVREVRGRSNRMRKQSLPDEIYLEMHKIKAFHTVDFSATVEILQPHMISSPFPLRHNEVNVISGRFSDTASIPYSFNGFFFIISIPEQPQFQICNNTNFLIAISSELHDNRRMHYDLGRPTRKKFSRIEKLPRENKKINASFGTEIRNASQKILSAYCSIAYAPLFDSNSIEKTTVKLKILGPHKSKWTTHSMTNVTGELTAIPIWVQKAKDDSKNADVGGNSTRDKPPLNVENVAFSRRMRIDLYSILIVDSNGSRILVITESHSSGEKAKLGELDFISMKDRSKHEKTEMVAATALRPPPWISLIIHFSLPRLTCAWIHNADVLLALHLKNLLLMGTLSPKALENRLKHVSRLLTSEIDVTTRM
ncbi:hypothetical protein IE077_002514, partial [Cardiosporidium cionae]